MLGLPSLIHTAFYQVNCYLVVAGAGNIFDSPPESDIRKIQRSAMNPSSHTYIKALGFA